MSEYILLAGANGLWRRVHCKKTCLYLLLTYKGVSVCSVSHRKTCLCAAFHLHISLWFVWSGMFPRKCLDCKTCSFPSSHTKKTCLHKLFTYEDMSQYSLAPTFPLLRLVWTKYGASALYKTLCGRVRIQRLTYEAVSACISVPWPTCLHAWCLTKYVLTHKFSPLTWFLCCWDHTRCSVLNQLQLVCNLVFPPTLRLSCTNWLVLRYIFLYFEI